MKSVEVYVDGQTAGTADARYENHFIFAITKAVDNSNECLHEDADAAPGTPDMREPFA